MLTIEKLQVSNHVVLKISGRMDAEHASQFEDACEHCIAQGQTHLIADLGSLAYISSIGLRSFISIAKKLQSKGGSLRICCMMGLVKQVFDITGLAQVFSVYDSVDSAVR
ncbi:MAG: STAS domain-containing protein [Acidobacteriaceae bacterium]|nr:STAS domain-containing protein [Acidobacteriaceae bacterium]